MNALDTTPVETARKYQNVLHWELMLEPKLTSKGKARKAYQGKDDMDQIRREIGALAQANAALTDEEAAGLPAYRLALFGG